MSTQTQTQPQVIAGVDFVSIPAENLEESIAFYRDTLGLEEVVHMPEHGFAEFDVGGLMLNVHCSRHMGLEHYRSPAPIALRVDDVAEARARLEEQGVPFRGDTIDNGVCHLAVFCDPNGNALMLHHRYERRARQRTQDDWWQYEQ